MTIVIDMVEIVTKPIEIDGLEHNLSRLVDDLHSLGLNVEFWEGVEYSPRQLKNLEVFYWGLTKEPRDVYISIKYSFSGEEVEIARAVFSQHSQYSALLGSDVVPPRVQKRVEELLNNFPY